MSDEFDIPLTESQIEFLSNVSKGIRDKHKLTEGMSAIVNNFWALYAELFIYQAKVANSKKKKSTQTGQRRRVVKNIKKYSGHSPNENEVRAMLAYGGEIDESIVPLILKDIEQLSVTPSRRTGIEALEYKFKKLTEKKRK